MRTAYYMNGNGRHSDGKLRLRMLWSRRRRKRIFDEKNNNKIVNRVAVMCVLVLYRIVVSC